MARAVPAPGRAAPAGFQSHATHLPAVLRSWFCTPLHPALLSCSIFTARRPHRPKAFNPRRILTSLGTLPGFGLTVICQRLTQVPPPIRDPPEPAQLPSVGRTPRRHAAATP